jgi:hypothetical protein
VLSIPDLSLKENSDFERYRLRSGIYVEKRGKKVNGSLLVNSRS